MKRGVSWNGSVYFTKRLCFVGVSVALLCVCLADFSDGNGSMPEETSCNNGVHENSASLYCGYEFEQNDIGQQRKAHPHATLSGDKSPRSMAEHGPIRPSRKLAEAFGQGNENAILIGVVVSTIVLSLGIFAFMLFCCVGRDALKVEPVDEKEDDKLVVNLKSKGFKGLSQRITGGSSFRPSRTASSLHNKTSSPTTGILPPPPGRAGHPPPTPPPPPPRAPPPPPTPAAPPPPAPPPPKPSAQKAPPAPPPKATRPPPPNPTNIKKPLASVGGQRHVAAKEENNKLEGDSEGKKTKLKPFFWDKVNAVHNRSMVWHHLRDGSFQFDEEMMEGLFGYTANQNKKERPKATSQPQQKLIQIIDAKKAQNLAILLKALNVTTQAVCDAVKKGTQLPVELISTLLKMAPTPEEELKLRLYNGDLMLLGPSERFLKNLAEIPYAFKRLEALLFMSSLQEDYSLAKESFATLEVACNKLRNSRIFMKLLEAVLKTGNRMNNGTYRGGAEAFKLDTLLKLSDVKGTDGKTTLLSFVVQEIIRYEGIKVARALSDKTENVLEPKEEVSEYHKKLGLEIVSKLSEELDDVKKAAIIDGDALSSTVSKLGNKLKNMKDFMNEDMKNVEEATEFSDSLMVFLKHAEAAITWMLEEEKRIMALAKSTGDYFHGKSGKDEGLRLFLIVRDFLKLLDNTCNEVRKTMEMQNQKNARRTQEPPHASENKQQNLTNDHDKAFFPTIKGKKVDDSTSNDSSEDDDEAKHNRKERRCTPNAHDKPLFIKDEMNALGSNDEEMRQTLSPDNKYKLVDDSNSDDEIHDDKKEAQHMPSPLAFEKTCEQSLPNGDDEMLYKNIKNKQMNDLNSEDDEVKHDQEFAQHMPTPSSSKETCQRYLPNAHDKSFFVDTEEKQNNDSSSKDDTIRDGQKEAQHMAITSTFVETRRPFVPNVHEKLMLLAMNDTQINDSDSDDWSSDDDDDEMGHNHKEAHHMPIPYVSQETCEQSFRNTHDNVSFQTIKEKHINDWSSDDDEISSNQKEAQHIPSPPTYEEECQQTLSNARHKLFLSTMKDKVTNDFSFDNDETRHNQKEVRRTLTPSTSKETHQHSLPNIHDNKDKHMDDLKLYDDETRHSGKEVPFTPTSPTSKETCEQALSNTYDKLPFPTFKDEWMDGSDSIEFSLDNDKTTHSQKEKHSMSTSPASEGTYRQSVSGADDELSFSAINDKQMDDSNSDDDNERHNESNEQLMPTPFGYEEARQPYLLKAHNNENKEMNGLCLEDSTLDDDETRHNEKEA